MILIIDDDTFVREAITDILGYENMPSLAAASGKEGIALYREHMGEIQLVLLDMSMPDMDGVETCRELHKVDTDVRVLLSSGYTDKEIGKNFPKGSILGFLQKPYDLMVLVSTIQHYL